MTTSRSKLIAVLVALACVIIGLQAGPAAAQDQTQPPPGGQGVPVIQSWALTPTTAGEDAGSRSAFTYSLAPGTSVQDSVTLWNLSNVSLTFRVYATDASNDDAGAFDPLAGSDAPSDAGTWVTLPQEYYTIEANTQIDLPFTVTVPNDARPGDHAGAILASNEAQGTGPDGKVVTLDRRTGTRMYVRVGGDLNPQLAVTKSTLDYHGGVDPRRGGADLVYTVKNVGNVRMGADQKIELRNVFGRTTKSVTPPAIEELLPGEEVTLTQHFDGVTAGVRVSATISLTPKATKAGDDVTAAATKRSTTTWAIPWLVLVVAVVAVLAFRAARWLRRRSNSRHTTPMSPPPRVREPVAVG